MSKHNRSKFATKVSKMADKWGIRVGFLVVSDEQGTSGYSTYESLKNANKDLIVLRDMLQDLQKRG